VLHLYVSEVDQVLHLPPYILLHRLGFSSPWCWLGIRYDATTGAHYGSS
jgi:hypothetical protein